MAERPISEIIPSWIKDQPHIIYPRINTVFVDQLGRGQTEEAAITALALRRYPEVFESQKTFSRANLDWYLYSQELFHNSPYLVVPNDHPEVLVKQDPIGQSIKTLMTLEYLKRHLPIDNNQYRYQPLNLFWASSDKKFREYFDYLVMDKVPTQPLSQDDEVFNKYCTAVIGIQNEAREVGVNIYPGSNDVLYRGLTRDNRAIVTLVDEADQNILSRISAGPPIKQPGPTITEIFQQMEQRQRETPWDI